jgi:2-iminobutanoate/2-iminopropanoate deaminase
MNKTAVTSPELAPPVGPFSQAIEVGGFLYFSGQVGQDPATGKVVEGGIVAETERVFRNLSAVLKAAGKSFDDVARAGVYLTSMSDFVALRTCRADRLLNVDEFPRDGGQDQPAALSLSATISQYFIGSTMPESANSSQQPQTIIEIRPYRGAWQCLEGPGVQPYWTGGTAKEDAIGYATARAKFGRREISVSETSPLIIDCSVHRLRQFPPLESPRKPPLLHSSVHARLYVRYPQAMGV